MQDYTNFSKTIQRIGRASIQEAEEITEKMINSQDDEFEDNSRIQVYDLLDQVLELKQNGDPDDYHNYSVTMASIYDYDAACQILECGLKKYPNNVDLLADYLNYSTQSSDESCWDKCWNYYNHLLKIDKGEWTWRCYAFIINFLRAWRMYVQDKEEILKAKELALDVSEEYIKRHPLDDRAYLLYYKLKIEFNPNITVKKKEDLLNKLIVKAGAHSVRCSILLAELKIENKQYVDAIKILDNELQLSIDPTSLDVGHVYLLRCIAKAALLIGKLDKIKKSGIQGTNANCIDSELIIEIKEVYSDYHIAQKSSKNSKEINMAKKYIHLLEILSGIENDYDYI